MKLNDKGLELMEKWKDNYSIERENDEIKRIGTHKNNIKTFADEIELAVCGYGLELKEILDEWNENDIYKMIDGDYTIKDIKNAAKQYYDGWDC